MRISPRKSRLAIALAAGFVAPATAHAVTLNPDGLGQALIYPYYTVQSDNGNSWNTYITVVNHSGNAKAVRVRFREGRNARPVLSLNVFLSPTDVWTAALIQPGSVAGPAHLVTSDTSCTSPTIPRTAEEFGIDFSNASYSGASSDGFGEGLDRTREGFVEIIEMATLTGATAAAVTHNNAGIPANCAAVQGNAALGVAPPSGSLSGTLTLINVNSGMDFNANAEALAELSTRPYYRPASDAYPDFNAAEIDPVSTILANGKAYRSVWARPVDAVSAVLMRTDATTEFILDSNTRSRTDHVVTFPTRSFYMQGTIFSGPFDLPPGLRLEHFIATVAERNGNFSEIGCGGFAAPSCGRQWAWAANVLAIDNFSDFSGGLRARSLLGSRNGWTADGISSFQISVSGGFTNGAITYRVSPIDVALYRTLVSQDASLRFDVTVGAFTGPHVFRGLPMMVTQFRTFENGTLTCSAGACQGNYGGSFPAAYRRNITP